MLQKCSPADLQLIIGGSMAQSVEEVEKAKAEAVQDMYLPLNDPLRNPVNKWQVLAHRSNDDFQPLIDHFCALAYMTKYASKAEKGSKSLDMLLAAVLARPELEDESSASRVYSAVMAQQIGGRNWSAQEVASWRPGSPQTFTRKPIGLTPTCQARCIRRKPSL